VRVLLVQRFDIQNVSCTRRIVAFAGELHRRGHIVTLVNFPHAERRRQMPGLDPSLPDGVEILELDRRGAAFFTNVRILSARAGDVDLIHLWKSYPDASLPALHAARRARRPLHYDWDDWETGISRELTGSRLVSHLVAVMENRLPRMADTVTVASTELRRQALSLGVPENRIWDAPVGVDLERFRPAAAERNRALEDKLWPSLEGSEAPILIYVGQLEVASFVEQTLSVVAKLRRQVRLLIVGGGARLRSLRTKAWSLGINNRVAFTDYVPEDRVPDYLSMADIALAPFDDTMVTRCKSPLKVVEYLAAGLPVVGSAVGEVPRLLSGCGLTVPPGDTAAMALAVGKLIEDAEARAEFGRLARRRAAELFGWSPIVDNLVKAYEAALA